jgi:hypothetical protein
MAEMGLVNINVIYVFYDCFLFVLDMVRRRDTSASILVSNY